MKRNALAHAIALASTGIACAASQAADIVLVPPATGGVSITNAAGSAIRWRVGEDGSVSIPGALRIDVASPAPTIILGASDNTAGAGAKGATIGGGGMPGNTFDFGTLSFGCTNGCENHVFQHGGTVGGGFGNRAGNFGAVPTDGGAATVSGGLGNTALGTFTFVGGGSNNSATGSKAATVGGESNEARGAGTFIGAGSANLAEGSGSVIGGGVNNHTAAIAATIPGGNNNVASGNFSFAAGYAARAQARGVFAWADSSNQYFDAATNDEFAARATGGFRFVTQVDLGTGAPITTFSLGANGRMTLPDDFAIHRGADRFTHMTGTRNAFLGLTAGNAIATGFENAALGYEALLANTDGAGNTAMGYRAMVSNTTGFNSTAVGAQALANSTGGSNLGLGAFAGANITTGSSNIMIGNGGDAADNATIRLGNGQARAFISGIRGVTTGVANAIAVFVDSTGQLGTASSSRAVKQDIVDMGEASDALMRLRPVTFRYKSHVAAGQDAPQYGLIAEEVAEVAPELVARSSDGRIETVNYQFLAPMLVNEVQQQRRVIAEQSARIDTLAGELAAIRQALGLR